MKNGKNPTREQRKFIDSKGINAENWLIAKDTPKEMLLVHRLTNATKTLYKGEATWIGN